MAIAFQASSESHTGTTGVASVASFTWNHAFTSTSDGLAVFVYGFNSSTDIITSVTAGGINVPLIGSVAASFAADSTTEPGFIEVYFLGSGLPTTTSAIVVNRTNNTVVTYANAITVTSATAETFVTGLGEFNENQSITSVNIDDGGNVGNSLRMMGFYTGAATPPTANSATTVGPVGLNIDIGAYGAGTYYELTAGSGSRPIGFSATHNDDTAAIYFAISEVTYNLTELDCIQDATSSADTITQNHILTDLDCIQDSISGTGVVTVISSNIDLTTTINYQDNLSSTDLIIQTHELLQSNSSQSNFSTSITISQIHVITGSTVELLNKNFVGEPAGILSAPWVQQGDSNVAVTTTGNLKGNSAGRSIAWYSGPTYTPNQYAEITLKTIDINTGQNHGIGLRIQTDTKGYERGYIFKTGNAGNAYRIDAYNNASNSVALIISSTVFPAVNDRLRFEANGNILTGYVNGIQILQITDNLYSSGVPAVYFFSPAVAESNDFVVGNLGEANVNTTFSTTGTVDVIPNSIDLIGSNLSQDNSSTSISISQTHILTSSNVFQSNTSNTGIITEIHLLSSDNISQSSVSNIGVINQTHVISSANASQTANINTISISQIHILNAFNVNQLATTTTNNISQNHIITQTNSSQSATSLNVNITQNHIITQTNSSQNANSLNVNITQNHILVQANSIQTNLSSTDAIVQGFVINLIASENIQNNASNTDSITQIQILASVNVLQSSISTTNNISQVHVLVSTGVNEQNNSTTNQISQNHILAHSPASQSNNSSINTILQSHVLIALNSNNDQTTTSNNISQIHQLSTQNVSTVNTTTSNNIVQLHNISIATTTQSNNSESVAITSSGGLTVTANIQNNISSSNIVTQIHFLSSESNSTLANISNNSITQNQIISVNINTQSNTTTDSLISQIHQLIAQSAIQINLSNSGVFTSILTAGFNNQYNISNGEQIIQTGYYIRKYRRIGKLPKYLLTPKENLYI